MSDMVLITLVWFSMPFFFNQNDSLKERYPIASCVCTFSQSSIKEQKRRDRIQSLCHFWWFIHSGHQLGVVVWSTSTIPSDGNSSQPPHQVWVGLSISMPCPPPGIWGEHDVTTHDSPPHSVHGTVKGEGTWPQAIHLPGSLPPGPELQDHVIYSHHWPSFSPQKELSWGWNQGQAAQSDRRASDREPRRPRRGLQVSHAYTFTKSFLALSWVSITSSWNSSGW